VNRISFAFFFMLLGATGAQAQMEPAPGQRLFDIVSGIVFSCTSATGFAWTAEACGKLSAEFRKRAEAAKLAFVEVPITADFKTKKLETSAGFDQDKAVRVFWSFTDQSDAKGVISGALTATRIWEPTAKEIPNAAPGQRLPLNFWVQSALFPRGTGYKDAAEYLGIITDSFFKVGESRR
jgi:hypothetical protein